MSSKYQEDELQCSRFEMLLAEFLDQDLSGADKAAFDAHARSCRICGPMLEEAREGLRLLRALEEVEPPKNLVHNILAATSVADSGSKAHAATGARRFAFLPMLGGLLRSRFATSFCMAFFSLSLTLTVAGVRISDITKIDWRPNSLRKVVVLQYTQVESSVLRYYENLRIVNEVGLRVKALRKATAAPGSGNQEKPKKNEKDTSERPDQHPDYSMEKDDTVIAESNVKHEGIQL